ncbi:MAG: S1 RNA-binding domain-containing protein [Candidatus Omnitrophica bacterium]|nr:S1 RNA-binding domain-containing protein [Candidatus Omnitrophota bacterium]
MSDIQDTLKTGDLVEGEVYKVTNFGAFLNLPNGKKGLLHISQISDDFIKNINEHINIGDKIKVRVASVDGDRIDLTVKKIKDSVSFYPKDKDFKSSDFEDKLNSFLKTEMKTMRGRAAR